jgi:Tol biopolymer transport system component
MSKRGKLRALGWLSLAVTFLFLPGAAQAAFPGANGRIAYTVERWRSHPGPPGYLELLSSRIEAVLPSGRGRRVLRTCPAGESCFDSDPAWSADGRWIAFTQTGLGFGTRLAIVRHNGSGLRRLPQLTLGSGTPAWSPGGRRLAFGGGDARLYTVRSDGTGLRQVTPRYAVWPAWSLTGRIAFSYDDGFYTRYDDGLFTIRPDGSQERRLINIPNSPGPPESPEWSPHATKIAFVVSGSVDPEIHVADASGRGRRRLSRDGAQPAWSPNGKYIAFIRNQDLYVMRSNGRGVRRVVDAPGQDPDHPEGDWTALSSPSWQPLRG